MKIGDLVETKIILDGEKPKYGIITDIRAGGYLAFIHWMDGTTGLLDDSWFKVISTDRDNKKT